MDPVQLKIGIVGAGAIGTALAGSLMLAGQPVMVVARGARRDVILRHGLRWRENDEVRTVVPKIGEMHELADRDVVIIATKATALPDLLPQVTSVLAPMARVMPAVNGLPWWYFQNEGSLSATMLPIHPGAHLQALLPADRVIGCVVYSRASMRDDGEVEIFGRQRLKIGSIGPAPQPEALAAQLAEAGIAVSLEENIRREVWRKMVRNASTNLVSGLTGATLEQIGQDSELLEVACAIAREVVSLSHHVGCPAEVDMAEFIDEIRRAGPFATSMLQDIRAGREPELDALAAVPLEVAKFINCEMPTLRHIAALLQAQLRNERHCCGSPSYSAPS